MQSAAKICECVRIASSRLQSLTENQPLRYVIARLMIVLLTTEELEPSVPLIVML